MPRWLWMAHPFVLVGRRVRVDWDDGRYDGFITEYVSVYMLTFSYKIRSSIHYWLQSSIQISAYFALVSRNVLT